MHFASIESEVRCDFLYTTPSSIWHPACGNKSFRTVFFIMPARYTEGKSSTPHTYRLQAVYTTILTYIPMLQEPRCSMHNVNVTFEITYCIWGKH